MPDKRRIQFPVNGKPVDPVGVPVDPALLRNVVCTNCGSVEFRQLQSFSLKYNVLDTKEVGIMAGDKVQCIYCGWFAAQDDKALWKTLSPEDTREAMRKKFAVKE